MNFAGKYVCWGNDEGGFCFGRIESEAVVNTTKGLRDVFILVERLSRSADGVMAHNPGKTTLRKEMIDLKKDVFDRRQGMEDLTNDQLFMLALAGKADAGNIVHKGVANMLEAEQGKPLEELAKARLKDRMGMDDGDESVKAEIPTTEDEEPNVLAEAGSVCG